jgi:hypothetical protein
MDGWRFAGGYCGKSKLNFALKGKRIILILVVLVFLAAGFWAFSRPQKVIVVKGDVSAQEVAEIKRAVRRDMARMILPNWSWASIKAFPSQAKWYFRKHLESIEATRPGHAYVLITDPSEQPQLTMRYRYEVIKGTNGWKAYQRIDILDIY